MTVSPAYIFFFFWLNHIIYGILVPWPRFEPGLQQGEYESLSHVWLFATPWTAAHQASLSFVISLSLLRLMSIELMMPSNHFISVITEYWIKFPVLYRRSFLVVYFIYSCVYMSIPITQLTSPHSFSPSNYKFVFYICSSISVFKVKFM